jgi:hypothetical protein
MPGLAKQMYTKDQGRTYNHYLEVVVILRSSGQYV